MDISNSGFVSPNQYSDVYLTSALMTSSLVISPATITLNVGGAQTFSASGGTSSSTYTIVTDNFVGRINSSTAAYVRGTRGRATENLQATKKSGNTTHATLSVRTTLAPSATSA